MTAQQLYDDIIRYVGADNFANWYVGIAANIEQRLFGDHRVHKNNHWWIHGQMISADRARFVETAVTTQRRMYMRSANANFSV